MMTNHALWLPRKGAALEVRDAPIPAAGEGRLVVRVAAVAVNPIDWILRSVGGVIFPWLRYPTVLGSDVAGEVVSVGAGVARFHVGDRVLGHAVGQDKGVNDPAEGAFQRYAALREHMATPIPPGMSFEQGAVLPLGLSTAACGLFQDDQLALSRPGALTRPDGEVLLVWGGSTSVGSNAVQLAVAAGYEVYATASPQNHGYVRGLGAKRVFDYRDPKVVLELREALRGRTVAGAIAIGTGAAVPCVDVVAACRGGRFVSVASPPVSFDDAPEGGGGRWLAGKMARLVLGNARLALRARIKGVRFKFIFGTTLLNNGVGRMVYADFLPAALASGRYRPLPEPRVVGHGLEAIPEALEVQRRGVSATKVVVTL